MEVTLNPSSQIPEDIKHRFDKKSWDAGNYVYWGITSLFLGLFILEFFLLKSIWQTTFFIKLALVGLSFFFYDRLRKYSKSPNFLVLTYSFLFTTYCLTIIHLENNYIVTVYFSLVTIVISVTNYLMLWKARYSLIQILLASLVFLAFEWSIDFESFWETMSLGGYVFFSFVILTAFIPDARKRNYLLNIDRELKKQKTINSLSVEVNDLQTQLEELLQINKIDREKEKILRHDLKNKINNIIGLSQLIDGENHEEDMMYIQLLRDVSTDLLKYADNLYSKNQEKLNLPLKVNLESINLYAVFNKTKSEIQPKLEKKDIELILPENETDVYIEADFLVINNVFENLLNYLIGWSNPHSKIKVTFTTNEHNIKIGIEAPSTNISPNDLNNIFQPIENFEFNSSFDAPKGLGLQIAKSMTEKLGGYFKYQTDLEGGVTFKLEFKAAKSLNI